jgi:hypothetical protein
VVFIRRLKFNKAKPNTEFREWMCPFRTKKSRRWKQIFEKESKRANFWNLLLLLLNYRLESNFDTKQEETNNVIHDTSNCGYQSEAYSVKATGFDIFLGLQAFGILRISRQSAHEDGKVVSPTHRPSLPFRRYFWYSEAESTVRKDYVNEKSQWSHRESNTPHSGL